MILCGGSGSRLWPASRPDRPKPLLRLLGDRTLLRDTVDRFAGFEPPWVVCGADHANAVAAELPGVHRLVEASPRGTAAAVALAVQEAHVDDLLLVVPADHAVRDPSVLRDAVHQAAGAARDHLVTFGVVPTEPATGYGWIEPGEPLGHGVLRVRRFVEKPDRATAEGFLAGGRHLWNSGMFLFRAGLMREELPPDPRGSLDVVVMERTRRAAVIPVDCGWSDVGTWSALAHRRPFVWSDGQQVEVLGDPDVIVVATGGAVLVTTPEHAHRCATVAVGPVAILDRGPGWEVHRVRLVAGEALDVTDHTVVLSGGNPGEVLPSGRWVATEPTVVLVVRTRPGPAGGSAAG